MCMGGRDAFNHWINTSNQGGDWEQKSAQEFALKWPVTFFFFSKID